LEARVAPVGHSRPRRLHRRRTWKEVQRTLRCQACGAELTMTHDLVRCCAFCGSTDVLVRDSQRAVEQPDGFLPFKIDERQALDAIHALPGWEGLTTWWAGWADREPALRMPAGPGGDSRTASYSVPWPPQRKREAAWMHIPGEALESLKAWWGSRKLKARATLGVYLPFWMFNGAVEVCWSLKADFVLPPQEELEYDNLLFPGVDLPDPGLLKKIYPFDTDAWGPYEPRLLADWPAQLPNLDVEAVVEEAYDTMIETSRLRVAWSSLPARAGDPGSANVVSLPARHLCQVTSITYQLALLPVWVALMQCEGERRLAVVNGQTGEAALGRPLPNDS
jgi:hypothetical protein